MDLRLPALDIVLQVPNPGIDLAPLCYAQNLRDANESTSSSFEMIFWHHGRGSIRWQTARLNEVQQCLFCWMGLQVAILVRHCLAGGQESQESDEPMRIAERFYLAVLSTMFVGAPRCEGRLFVK